jgi:hypothetical protein
MAWLETCVTGMSDQQLAAILTKYLKDRPEEWRYSVHFVTHNALKGVCPK